MKEWVEKDGKLSRGFTFDNFEQAVRFINAVAKVAEEANHHPDILLHDYKKVLITLTTHSEGGVVTGKDRKLAKGL
jgi:4a-hydroxytetrahydrobiopterin dehydratase